MSKFKKIIFFLLIAGSINNTYSQNFSKRKINNLKTQISHMVEDDKKMTQVMIDKVFSFGELGFQEFETSKYMGGILEENGFDVKYKISDIPNTCKATIKAIRDLNFDYITIHINCGLDALRAAKKVAGRSKLIGVTTLTSLNSKTLKEIGFNNRVTNG